MTKLYHVSVYWQDAFNAKISKLLSKPHKYSHHALERLYEPNRSHEIDASELESAINYIKTNRIQAFECEVDNNGRIIKFVIRTRLNNKEDVIVVFMDKGDCLLIKTYFTNSNKDKHKTLNKSKYQSN